MTNALQLKDKLYWVGVLDKDLRVFDIIMRTEYGTTYNAYLLRGTKHTVLTDTCKEPFFDEQIAKIEQVCPICEIDTLVVHHTEPDHSGSIARLLEMNPNIRIYASTAAINFLKEIVGRPFDATPIKDGDSLDLGGMTMQFISAPFLHWPDTVYSYVPELQTLITCDSFGSHYADERIVKSKIDFDYTDAFDYYFDNIIAPYTHPYLDNALRKIAPLKIGMICPGHGPVIDSGIDETIAAYRAKCETEPQKDKIAVIAYVSSYGYTAELARVIADVLTEEGIKTEIYNLTATAPQSVADRVHAADALLVGSPTILGDSLPPVNMLIDSLNPTIDRGKFAGAFGSYAWSGEGVPNLEARLNVLKFKIPVAGVRVKLKPDDTKRAAIAEFARAFAAEMKK